MLSSFQECTVKELLTAICNNALPSRARSIPSFSASKVSSTAFAKFECSANDAYCSNPVIKVSNSLSWPFPKRMLSGKITSAASL
jgi:hypothetical protein